LATRGYDDVVFEGNKVFLSYTNPANPGDPVLVQLVQGDHPTGLLTTKTVLTFGATGLDTVTGQIETVPLNDPDSMKMAPNGDLILSSGDDGTIIDISKAGTAQQSVSFTPIAGVTAGHAGLDDVIKPDATSGTFTLTDAATNKVYSFHATGLNTNDYYASVGSLKAFGQVDPTTERVHAAIVGRQRAGLQLRFTARRQLRSRSAGGCRQRWQNRTHSILRRPGVDARPRHRVVFHDATGPDHWPCHR
jgi:hypothetical protein